MCGRYAIAPDRADAWACVNDELGADVEAQLAALAPRYNVAPSQQVPIVVQDRATGAVHAEAARWGFVPRRWREAGFPKFSTINARMEEARVKPLWRDAFRQARCLVPATHWYEWRRHFGARIPHALARTDGAGFMFAGLYSRWAPDAATEPIHTCAILTRPAAPALRDLHDRMPVMLAPRAWRAWLDPLENDGGRIEALLRDHAVLEARAWPVSTLVNATGNDARQLLDPA